MTLREHTIFAVLAAALALLGAPAAVAQAPPDDAALAPRGEYLARAADCMPCHSGDPAKPYGGGLALNTPFGAIFSANITSEPSAGIGKWTYEQFRNAVHNGIRADGAYLYPAMPFDSYTKIEEDDLKALWAFIRRLPPVSTPTPANKLSFPFDIRVGMLAWRELFFTPRYFQPAADNSDAWNRGAYLVEALGHCGDCHSPRNIMGAVKGKAPFVGAEIDGFYAPDIASAALLKTWDKASLVEFLKTGVARGKTVVFGPMSEVVHDSSATLTDADRDAMATYLLDSPPPADKPAPQAASQLSAEVYAEAAHLYVENCAGCHLDGGVGVPNAIPPLTGNPAVTAAEPYNVITAVLQGLPPDGGYGAMPSFAGRLSDEQVARIVNYVRTSWGNTGAPNATDTMVAAWRATVTVPDYGTQAASALDCPQVGGTPGSGPNPQAVAQISEMLAAGNRDISELVNTYQGADTDAEPADVVNAMIAAYCPVVAASGLTQSAKIGELKRFSIEVAADVSPASASTPLPSAAIISAVPVGRSLIARQPDQQIAAVSCPTRDGGFAPAALVTQATALIGTATLPIGGTMAADLATALAKGNRRAKAADIANALIAAYCPIIQAGTATEPAQKNAWLQSFGAEVIQTLQVQTTSAAN